MTREVKECTTLWKVYNFHQILKIISQEYQHHYQVLIEEQPRTLVLTMNIEIILMSQIMINKVKFSKKDKYSNTINLHKSICPQISYYLSKIKNSQLSMILTFLWISDYKLLKLLEEPLKRKLYTLWMLLKKKSKWQLFHHNLLQKGVPSKI